MIRRRFPAIFGTEMLNPNHWFVANDHGPELRISAWSGHNRLSAAARHLCGQKCLHKLVDGFMAKALSVSTPDCRRQQVNTDFRIKTY